MTAGPALRIILITTREATPGGSETAKDPAGCTQPAVTASIIIEPTDAAGPGKPAASATAATALCGHAAAAAAAAASDQPAASDTCSSLPCSMDPSMASISSSASPVLPALHTVVAFALLLQTGDTIQVCAEQGRAAGRVVQVRSG